MRVALLGKGSGFWEVNDVEVDQIWGVNNLPIMLHPEMPKKFHKIFNMHPWGTIENKHSGLIEWCTEHKVTLVTLHARPDIEVSESYPIEDILKRFRNFFSNAFCYMIAYALWYGTTELWIFGFNGKDESGRREAMRYWIGVAEGMGVKVTFGKHSILMNKKFFFDEAGYEMYGYDSHKKEAYGWESMKSYER